MFWLFLRQILMSCSPKLNSKCFFFFGIMAFVSEGIPVKLLSAEINPTKSMFFKLNFHKNKLLINFSYNLSRNPISSHLETSGRSLYLYSTPKLKRNLKISDNKPLLFEDISTSSNGLEKVLHICTITLEHVPCKKKYIRVTKYFL